MSFDWHLDKWSFEWDASIKIQKINQGQGPFEELLRGYSKEAIKRAFGKKTYTGTLNMKKWHEIPSLVVFQNGFNGFDGFKPWLYGMDSLFIILSLSSML